MTARRSFFIALALQFTCAPPGAATPLHGVWFWGSTELAPGLYSSFGSIDVVGSAIAEDETVNFMTSHDVGRVYGSYQNRPVTDAAAIRAWNAKLDAAGIGSQLLLSGFELESHLTDPTHASLVNKANNRLVAFNDAATSADQRFDALHLDLEPQALSSWSSGTPAEKRAFLDDLLDAYIDLRAALDTGGYTSLPIYADIPWSWDKLPTDGGSIGWADAADRDAWYAAIGVPLDGVSIMTFSPSKDTLPEIADATENERTGTFPGDARVAIQAKVGPGKIWPTLADFESIVDALDTAFGPAEATDIENYAFWRAAFPPPTLTTATGLTAGEVGTAVIDFPFVAGNIYILRHSTNLTASGWQEIGRFDTDDFGDKHSGTLRVQVQTPAPRGFFSVTEIIDTPR